MTINGLLINPIRRISIAPMIASAVFPAPTSWNKPVEGSAIIRATAAR